MATAMLLTSVSALLLGVSLGATGVGGFLIPPLLIATLGLPAPAAVTHALLSFIASGALGTYLYHRRSGIAWTWAAALSLGCLPGAWVGYQIAIAVSNVALQQLLAVGLALVALLLLLSGSPIPSPVTVRYRRLSQGPLWWAILGILGLCSGITGVVAGVGGPLIIVPALSLLGADARKSVGAALLTSIVVSLAGASLLLPTVEISLVLVLLLIVSQIAGMLVGVRVAVTVAPDVYRRGIGIVTLVSATWILSDMHL
jgi:uncharacterized protein